MTGTSSKKAAELFLQGKKAMTFPVTKRSVKDGLRKFTAAIKEDGKFAKAYGQRGYCLITLYLEFGIDELEEDKGEKKKVLDLADEATKAATKLARYDYDTWWDRGACCSVLGSARNRRFFSKAIKCYTEARKYNDGNYNLEIEASEWHVSAGKYDDALALLNKARRGGVCHDWYRWSRAWAYYFKAQNDAAYYDMAIAEIRQMYWNPGEAQYLIDAQLLLAAAYAQKNNTELAKQAFQTFNKNKKKWSLEDETRASPLQAAGLKHWLNGCKKAGLR